MKVRVLVMGLVLAAGSSMVSAEKYMSGEELKKAFCGKTFLGENPEKGATFKVYYTDKCDEVIHHFLSGGSAGKTVTWKLRFSSDGGHCVTYDGKEKCAKFVSVNDKVYHAMRDGKVIFTRTNPTVGKHLDE
jgi:hypothetical protein